MLQGVYETRKKDGSTYYRASMNFKGKHISLGSSSDPKIASSIYREGRKIATTSSITIENFPSKIKHLSFEKAVVLLNYRDNELYIKTPIYMQRGFFFYYLSPSEALKFDTEDLFYYSSHKIIRRQGHLFVNDYGMQYNIAQRYGIKNFAVEGRDYIFINGDSHDFTYANIKIINKYHGITQTEKNNKTWYVAKLHLNGNVIVGKYTSEVKAAIAYNKGVDYARKKGIEKDFIDNYIVEMSAREYADAYTRIGLTDSFYDYIDDYAKKRKRLHK